MNTINETVSRLEEEVKHNQEEINSIKETYINELKEKSVDELLNIKHIEDNTYEVEVDGEVVQFEKTESKYVPLTENDITEEELESHFNRFKIPKDMYSFLEPLDRIELLNYLLEREMLVKEMEELQEKFQQELKDFNEELANASLNSKNDIIEMLNKKIELYKKYDKKSAIKETENIIEELLLSINLNTIKSSIKNIKNPSNVFNTYNDNFNNAEKKFFTRLSKNRKYRFIKPTNLLNDLVTNYGLEETHAKLFLYVFYNHVKNVSLIEKYSVCFNDIIYNIINPESLTEEQQKEFKISMLEVIGFFNE